MLRFSMLKACFIRRILVASNAIQTIDNEMIHLIIYCLNCIRRDRNATYKTGLTQVYTKFANFPGVCFPYFTTFFHQPNFAILKCSLKFQL